MLVESELLINPYYLPNSGISMCRNEQHRSTTPIISGLKRWCYFHMIKL